MEGGSERGPSGLLAGNALRIEILRNRSRKSRDDQWTNWRIVVNKGIQQQMGNIHGRLDLHWLPVLTTPGGGCICLSVTGMHLTVGDTGGLVSRTNNW